MSCICHAGSACLHGMDIRQLRYFVATIEEGSLSGAAQRMNIAQPALSRRIRDLEVTIGCELFIRGTRGVTPTLAGTTLYREAVSLLGGMDDAGRRVRRAGLDQIGMVRVGLVPTARKYAFAHRAIAACLAETPDLRLAFMRASSSDLATALRDGRLDISMLYERHVGSPAFGERLIHRERYVLAMHPEHRLAQAQPADLAELAGEPMVWLSRRATEGEQDSLMQQCRLHGLEPVIAHTAQSQDEQIDVVMVSGGLCLTPASIVLTTPENTLVFRPLPAFAMEVHLTLAWSAGFDRSPGGVLLADFHRTSDQHQLDIATGAAPWSRLLGKEVVFRG